MSQVLLVEGNSRAVAAVRLVVEDCGCHLVLAASPAEALSIVRSGWFRLILFDLDVAGPRAGEFLRDLHKSGQFAPVIAMAHRPSVRSAVTTLKMGAVDYLETPPQPTELRDALSPWLARKGPVHRGVAASLRAIAAEYRNSRLTLRTVARNAGVSPEYLCRLLKEHTNVTFLCHLHQCRVRAAERLLADTNLMLKEIADLTGFETTSRLNRWFRKLRGCSPTDFRSSHPGLVGLTPCEERRHAGT